MSSLLSMMPEHNFEVHVLRTFTRDLIGWLSRLQASSPQAGNLINHLIHALEQTFRDVEQVYLIWRHERIQSVLQHGFWYARARLEAAMWRRQNGRHPASFPNIYSTNYYYAGTSQAQPLYPPPPAYGSYPPFNNPAPNAGFPGSPQQHGNYSYTQGFRNEPATAGPSGQAPWHEPGSPQFSPPPFPPPYWKPPSPNPAAPPVSPEVYAGAEIATRYLEAVNKAVNVSIDLNAL
ncbi:hypothetical protein F5148DRAFT_560731 [Russula earlei]|uniref:Uncharacterized protein n=1 Tax=Russula earlei TaxID=71964 RepID=A0ACC0UPF7_9AGAM|nr:hypothetical protein F5148DRAFT_560731 [Russula earlei]